MRFLNFMMIKHQIHMNMTTYVGGSLNSAATLQNNGTCKLFWHGFSQKVLNLAQEI
jgi:hypothetical protein